VPNVERLSGGLKAATTWLVLDVSINSAISVEESGVNAIIIPVNLSSEQGQSKDRSVIYRFSGKSYQLGVCRIISNQNVFLELIINFKYKIKCFYF